MKKGKLLIISGFSGVGKGTVVKYIQEHYPNYKVSVSVTTREPRENEVDGIHYHFLSDEKFEQMVENRELLEHAGYVGHYYGTPARFVEENLEKGNHVILEIETQGAIKVKEKRPDAVMIFVLPPSGMALKERLVGRQTESQDVIEQRLEKAAEETKELVHYEYFVVNDKVEDCADNINKIIENKNPNLLDEDTILKIKKEILTFSKGE